MWSGINPEDAALTLLIEQGRVSMASDGGSNAEDSNYRGGAEVLQGKGDNRGLHVEEQASCHGLTARSILQM